MDAVFSDSATWHPGEQNIQRLLHVPYQENPTRYYLPPGVSHFLSICPLIAVGTTSPSGQPWASLLTGIPGFARNFGPGVIGMQAAAAAGDPIYETLDEGAWSEIMNDRESRGEGMIAGLAVNLERRQRVKFYGRSKKGMRRLEKGKGLATIMMEIEQTLGNCPKYMNARHLDLVQVDPPTNITANYEIPKTLPQEALDLISHSDMFFVASRNGFTDMDVNHRGGPPGFVRILPPTSGPSNNQEPTTLVWPEYSGNRLYQTLGNLQVTPLAGLTFADFYTGDMLYLTGTTEILIGPDAERVMHKSKLAVKFTVTGARYAKTSLGLRVAEPDAVRWSPYNPAVRYLATELQGQKALVGVNSQPGLKATLVKKEKLSDTIARFTFQLDGSKDKKESWRAGQYVMLGFEEELSAGYRHMDDSDPQGLNDDYIRSFTVSSYPGQFTGRDEGKFELTIRRVGTVTRYLFQQNPGAALEIPVQGFGGEFFVEKCEGGKVGIVAAGVGITPFIAQWKGIAESGVEVKLYWIVKEDDLGFVKELLGRKGMEGMKEALRLFVTGRREGADDIEIEVKKIIQRRIKKQDIVEEGDEARKWYVCTGDTMRKEVAEWLHGKDVSWEEFTY
ncbi:uncharacterized protein DFL_000584 [Arthrobotrys flagrans]|uniref:FAD-binding FR-type domain-containing protein n=1 Tax=Arthrobotrys flagrans TaxID=97331 RepID=A0A437AEB4_ARTFL|nr:hypothetical protein DFL_000584 [Arthrobotrys flagrans]